MEVYIVTDFDDPEELVPVHVPRSRLAEVYRLLGTSSGDPARAGNAPSSAATTDGTGEWTIEELATISGDSRKSFQIIQDLLDVLSASPDTYIPMSSICEQTGRTRDEIRGGLSGFGRVKIAKELGAPWWSSLEPTDADETVSEVRYMLSGQASERWGRLRA